MLPSTEIKPQVLLAEEVCIFEACSFLLQIYLDRLRFHAHASHDEMPRAYADAWGVSWIMTCTLIAAQRLYMYLGCSLSPSKLPGECRCIRQVLSEASLCSLEITRLSWFEMGEKELSASARVTLHPFRPCALRLGGGFPVGFSRRGWLFQVDGAWDVDPGDDAEGDMAERQADASRQHPSCAGAGIMARTSRAMSCYSGSSRL